MISIKCFVEKSPSQSCVSREYCAQTDIVHCFVVKTGVDPTGEVECALRCYNVPTFGDCIDGFVEPQFSQRFHLFDPENPVCDTAMDPPSLDALELATLGSSTTDSGSGDDAQAQ